MDPKEYIRESYQWFREERMGPIERGLALCESPIEGAFLWALIREHYSLTGSDYGTYGLPGVPDGTDAVCLSLDDTLYVYPQVTVTAAEGRVYRLDFACHFQSLKEGALECQAFIDVECDGHEWHERTKEQAERDHDRDRDLQVVGWNIARLTGSEIARNPAYAASKIMTMASGLMSADWDRRHPKARSFVAPKEG